MKRPWKMFSVLAVAMLVTLAAVPATQAQDPDARKAQILANLKLEFPQLDAANVTMGVIGPSGIDGLDQGSFTINGKQTQNFLITGDNTKLYLVAGEPLDVSRGAEEIEAEMAKRKAEEAKQAAERMAEIEAAIEGLPVRGNPDAPVTIVEFSDFQCPYCSRGANTMEQVLERYPDKVKFVFKHFPLGFHKWAKPAAIAAHCAAQQDDEAFWTLHDKYFEQQRQINENNVLAKSKDFLSGSGIDMDQWAMCAEQTDSEAYKAASAAVDADMAFGQKMGVSGTPGFFVNGEFLNGAQPVDRFVPLIEAATSGDSTGP